MVMAVHGSRKNYEGGMKYDSSLKNIILDQYLANYGPPHLLL